MANKETSSKEFTPGIRAKNSSFPHFHLHGAAVIDVNGNETPITEQMIQIACNKLICDWESSLSPKH